MNLCLEYVKLIHGFSINLNCLHEKNNTQHFPPEDIKGALVFHEQCPWFVEALVKTTDRSARELNLTANTPPWGCNLPL